MAAKCRCPICGEKNAGRRVRRHYIAAGIGRDEHNRDWNGRSKPEQRRLLRRREDRTWRAEHAA